MNKITTIETTAHLFDFDEMEKDIKKAQWCLINVDNGKKSIKLTKPELVEFINKAFNKNLNIQDIDHRNIIAHNDVAYIILRDMDGDLL